MYHYSTLIKVYLVYTEAQLVLKCLSLIQNIFLVLIEYFTAQVSTEDENYLGKKLWVRFDLGTLVLEESDSNQKILTKILKKISSHPRKYWKFATPKKYWNFSMHKKALTCSRQYWILSKFEKILKILHIRENSSHSRKYLNISTPEKILKFIHNQENIEMSPIDVLRLCISYDL